ncbi:MAG: hypothetical protein HWE20_14695 [Gammaproteobacteria bacterium]|nr:hypothetical protein [Gammaproteobacteria bacterium]
MTEHYSEQERQDLLVRLFSVGQDLKVSKWGDGSITVTGRVSPLHDNAGKVEKFGTWPSWDAFRESFFWTENLEAKWQEASNG